MLTAYPARPILHSCIAPRYSAVSEAVFHYVIVRVDLPRGIQAANIVHAAGESGPVPPDAHAVCLTVTDEPALRAVADRLDAAGIRFVSIIESEGRHAGQLMALGCMPAGKEALRRVLSALPLLR